MMLLLSLSGKRADARSLTRRTSRRPLPHLAQPHAPQQLAPLGAARAAAPCGNVIGARRPIVWHGWPGRLAPSAGLAAGLPATYGAQGRATKLAILSQIAAGMGGSPRRWQRKSLSTRSSHRWSSLGHQGGAERSRHVSHSGLSTPSGMYIFHSQRQHQ